MLHLRSEPGAEHDLATAALPLGQVSAAGFYHFSFAPIAGSHSGYYYILLEQNGSKPLPVGTATGDTYRDGAALQ